MDPKLLALLIERARTVRDDAVKVSTQARRDVETAAHTLRTLTDYREQSLDRGPIRSGQPVGTEQLRIAGQFDARLVSAISQQTGQHERSGQLADQRQAELSEAQRRLKAFEALAERRARRESVQQGRRDQRTMDAFASDRTARRKAQEDTP
jgi:flagellar FliJ protein